MKFGISRGPQVDWEIFPELNDLKPSEIREELDLRNSFGQSCNTTERLFSIGVHNQPLQETVL